MRCIKLLCEIKHYSSTRIITQANMNIFEGRLDQFNGVLVNSEQEPCHNEDFKSKLERSLDYWKENHKRGIWFRVNLSESDWIPVLAKNEFKFHHADDNYVMMLRWLPQEEECHVPKYAHTMVGVGAVVINEKDDTILVVRERYNKRPHWKLPGGYAEPGENLVDAAIREVFEETNIHTEFQSVLAFRHGHGGQFGCSDIYTTVSLKPVTFDIQKCDREIEECSWIKLEEYLSHPDIHELNKFFVQKYVDNKHSDTKIECTHGFHQILKKPYTVYHAVSKNKNKY